MTDNDVLTEDAFADAVADVLDSERIFEVNGKKCLLEEPTGAECEEAVKTFQKMSALSLNGSRGKQKTNAQYSDSLDAWKLKLVKRVLPAAVYERVGDGGVARFVAATGGWESKLVTAALRLYGVPLPKDGFKRAKVGDPGNPT